MQFLTLLGLCVVSAAALPSLHARGVDPSLVPDFGVQADQDPSGGSCAGEGGARIPCNCPPDRDDFISKLNSAVAAGSIQGVAVSFPTGSSSADSTTRVESCITVLENFSGAGVGCPVSSTNWASLV